MTLADLLGYKPDPKRKVIGYRPLTANPKGQDGNVLLRYTYEDEWPGIRKGSGLTTQADSDPEPASASCSRGSGADRARKPRCTKTPSRRAGGSAGRTTEAPAT